MKLSVVLEALVRSGATPDMLVAAVKAAEDDGLTEIEARRKSDAERKRRQRERERERSAWEDVVTPKSRDSHVQSSASEDVESTKKVSPIPPSKKQTLEFNPPKESPRKGEDHVTDDYPPKAFDIWYQGYPHKVGKLKAQESFKRVRKGRAATFAQLVKALDDYVRDKPIDRPWANPATWLNQGRWLDQPAEVGVVDSGRSDRVLQALKGMMGDGQS